MNGLAQTLGLAGAGIFLIAAGLVLRDYLRYRDENRAYQTLAVGLLALLTIVARVDELTRFQYRTLFEIRLTAYLLAAYALLLFAHTFVPIKQRTRLIAGLAVATTVVVALGARLPAEAPVRYSSRQLFAVIMIVAVTGMCILEPAVRFWMASRGKPLVQRRRLQAVSIGYSGIIALLVIIAASGPLSRRPVQAVVVNGLGLLLALLLYSSFATPSWLRSLWRRNEETSFSTSVSRLLAYSPDTESIAAQILSAAMTLIGTSGGAIWKRDGDLLAIEGLDPKEIEVLETMTVKKGGIVEFRGEPAVMTEMQGQRGSYSIALIAGPFTPIFGSEEVKLLQDFASAASIALDRVELVQALRHQTRRYESLLQTMSDVGMGFMVTEGARVLYANEAYERISGYSLEELLEMPSIIDLAHPDERETTVNRFTRRMRGEKVEENYESALVSKDGRRVDVAVGLKVLEEGERRVILTVINDISQRARAMRSLEAAYAKEKEGVRKLLELDEMKSDFLSTVSHELRTPLTTISGFADTLIARWESFDEAQKLAFTRRISSQAGDLKMLIEDLLDFTRIERGHFKLEFRPFDLRDEVIATLTSLGSSLQNHVLQAQVPEDTKAEADPAAFRRVLGNLLTNAAKFSAAGSKISIRVRSFGMKKLIVSVLDQGIGIHDQEKARIFERFYRVRRGDSAGYGTGIGLAIVREYVEAMGGRVWVEDSIGGGTIFSLTLPRWGELTKSEATLGPQQAAPPLDPVESSSPE